MNLNSGKWARFPDPDAFTAGILAAKVLPAGATGCIRSGTAQALQAREDVLWSDPSKTVNRLGSCGGGPACGTIWWHGRQSGLALLFRGPRVTSADRLVSGLSRTPSRWA
jgi:hypothetical protein